MFTIGCDPEFFLRNKAGEFIPAMDTVGGTKLEPRVLPSGHTVQEDGCAVEIGIMPATTAAEFTHYIKEALSDVKDLLKPMGLSPAFVAEATFKPEYLTHPKACEVGCDPDYDAYVGKKRTMYPYVDNVRYAGGHIHVGSDLLLNPEMAIHFIMAMDCTVGYACARKEGDSRRRAQVYGGPGKFRYKPYGVEYRSPSNVWLVDTKLQDYIFNVVKYFMETGDTASYGRYSKKHYARLVASMLEGVKSDTFERVNKPW